MFYILVIKSLYSGKKKFLQDFLTFLDFPRYVVCDVSMNSIQDFNMNSIQDSNLQILPVT